MIKWKSKLENWEFKLIKFKENIERILLKMGKKYILPKEKDRKFTFKESDLKNKILSIIKVFIHAKKISSLFELRHRHPHFKKSFQPSKINHN